MGVTLTRSLVTSLCLRAVLVSAVLVTVGSWAGAGAACLLTADMVIPQGRRVLANAAVVLFAAIPLVWLLGSTLPLAPPVPRIQDNTLAHQLGGLAVWTLVFAAVGDQLSTKRERS